MRRDSELSLTLVFALSAHLAHIRVKQHTCVPRGAELIIVAFPSKQNEECIAFLVVLLTKFEKSVFWILICRLVIITAFCPIRRNCFIIEVAGSASAIPNAAPLKKIDAICAINSCHNMPSFLSLDYFVCYMIDYDYSTKPIKTVTYISTSQTIVHLPL